MMPPQSPSSTGLCLCESGRPFRACCAPAFVADIAEWQQARETERRLVRRITEFALGTWGTELLGAALREFSMGRHSYESLRKALPVFDPWFVFTWIPNREYEFVKVPETWPTAPLGVAWLTSGSAALSDFDRAFIVTAAASPYSCLLVETGRSGWFVTVRDLMTGRRFRAVDPEISMRARPEDILLSAVLTLGRASTLLGTAAYTVSSDWRFELRDIRRCYTDAPWLTRAELMEMDSELCDGYREACDRGPVSTVDIAGDAREPLHLRWTISAPFDDILERLRPLTVCYGDEEAIDEEDGPEGERRVLMTWYEQGPSKDDDDWLTIGFLYLEEGRLAADVPTRALATRLMAEVTARLGAAATLVETRPSLPTRVHTRELWLPVPLE